MNGLTRFIWPALIILMLAAACGVNTRVAVKNSGDNEVDVTLSRGSDSVSFSAVAPGTTSKFKEIDWDGYGGVAVKTADQSTDVDLSAENDNTVNLEPDGGVSVEATYNEDNEYW